MSARDTVAIFGQGSVGLSATQLAAAMGARVIAVDVSAERAQRARDFGAAHVIDASAEDPVEAIHGLTGGKRAGKALDTSGAAPGRSAAVRCASAWGAVCFVGEGGEVTLNVSPDIIRKQLTLFGSWTLSTTADGVMPAVAKPLTGLGSGVMELALRHRGDAYRVVYAVQLGPEIWVIHAFQKKAKAGIKTPRADIDVVRERLKRLKEFGMTDEPLEIVQGVGWGALPHPTLAES